MYNSGISVLILITFSICSCCSPIEDNLNNLDYNIIVHTSDGKVGGHRVKSKILDIKYYAFQSIPYAEPPIGERRFKDPVPIGRWAGILNATKTPKACPQTSLSEDEMSEDCLVLNVYIPSHKSTNLRPVILWIHGGFFQIGHGGMLTYAPDFFVNEDVIVVSMNYRLGAFGYLSAEDDVLPGNYASKDQILALKWVHKNIAEFGGNPLRITLMGQSAGAASVGILLQTPATEGLFSAAILQSGNSLNLWARNLTPKTTLAKIANYFEIKYNNTQELVNEMQKIKWTDLILGANTIFVADTALSNPVNGLTVGPTVDSQENGILTNPIHEKLRTGNYNKVPILTGFNSGEGNIFIPMFDKFSLFLRLYDLFPSKLAPIDLNAESSENNAIGKKVKDFYFGEKSITSSKQSFSNFITDNEFIRPVQEFVRLLSEYEKIYFYRFAYVGQLPVIEEALRELPGTVHCEELQYLFYSPLENSPTAEDQATRNRLVKLWTNFAKYHNPTPHVDPLFQNITWEPVQPNQINYLDIDTDLRVLKNPNKNSMDFWASIYDTYGVPPYDTY